MSEPMSETLSLDQLIEKKEPIYVLNKSKPKGLVTITFFRPNGTPYILAVPKTWIPVCLTEQCSHETIASSDDLRRNLLKGMIQLMPKKDAEEILSSPDAVEEKNRLNLSVYGSYGITIDKGNGPSALDLVESTISEIGNVKVSVKDILTRQITANEQYHLLRAEEDDLSEYDFKYISVHGGSEKIKDWASSHLS